VHENDPLKPIREAIHASANWIRDTGTPAIVIGGVAASLLGKPRLTNDVDWTANVDESNVESFIKAAESHGITPLIKDAAKFAEISSIIPFIHRASNVKVDVAFALAPFELAAIQRGKWVSLRGYNLPLAAPDDLLIMKAVAHRPKDHLDVHELLLEKFDAINFRYVRKWIKDYAKAMESPGILSDFNKHVKEVEGLRKLNRKRLKDGP
jgi:hypothetical protein